MDVRFSDTDVTPHQAEAADRLEHVLALKARFIRHELPSQGNGPSIEFEILTTRADLSFRIIVYQDSVHSLANGALVMMLLDDEYDAWANHAADALTGVLAGPLRIRVRRTLLMRRETGAIFMQFSQGAAWNGDLGACRGKGTTLTFENWYQRPASG